MPYTAALRVLKRAILAGLEPVYVMARLGLQGSGYDEVRIVIMPEPENELQFRDALLDTCNWLEERDYPMVGLFSLSLGKGILQAVLPVGCRRARPRADLPGNREEATLKV